MNRFELKKLQKQYHTWSEHIDSYDFRATPKELKATITEAEFDSLLNLPYSLIHDQKRILVHETFEGWETVKDVFTSLDCMPVKYLHDIYDANKERYKDVVLNNITGTEEEISEKIIFCLIPDVIWTKE